MRLLRLGAVALLGGALTGGCAKSATLAAGCPTIATAWTPRTLIPAAYKTERPCVRPTPTPGAERLPFGPELDEALYCVDRYYTGPDGLPIAAMLQAAFDALARADLGIRVSAGSSGTVVLSPKDAGTPPLELSIDRVSSAEALTAALVRAAEFTRTVVPNQTVAVPEQVLLDGALSALAWTTDIVRPPFWHEPTAPQSFTAVTADGVAHVRAGTFVDGLALRFRGELSAHQVHGVVLDLRGSTGGLRSEVAAIADLFTREGCLVTSRPKRSGADATAHREPGDIDAPVVVLVNHGTAEGSEIVAATLRARGRAILIGEKTFGRGLLQTIVKLSSRNLLRISIGEILAGDGTAIHQLGIEPDLTVPARFEPTGAADRDFDFAASIVRRTKGNDREALLRAARRSVEEVTR
jgi:hypothetical protein